MVGTCYLEDLVLLIVGKWIARAQHRQYILCAYLVIAGAVKTPRSARVFR